MGDSHDGRRTWHEYVPPFYTSDVVKIVTWFRDLTLLPKQG